jgi:hypothetical protein
MQIIDYITWIIHQQLCGYKVEKKLHLGIREQNRLNAAGLENVGALTSHDLIEECELRCSDGMWQERRLLSGKGSNGLAAHRRMHCECSSRKCRRTLRTVQLAARAGSDCSVLWPGRPLSHCTVTSAAGESNVKQSYRCNRPCRPVGLWDVKDPTLSRQSAHS